LRTFFSAKTLKLINFCWFQVVLLTVLLQSHSIQNMTDYYKL